MRAGGVDPSRMGRKKRSPKPRPKRPKTVQDSSASVTPSDSQVTGSDSQSTQNTEEGGENMEGRQLEGVAYVDAPRERLATTPASPGDDGVIDICKKFQVG